MGAPHRETPHQKFGGAPSKIQNIGAHISDYTVTHFACLSSALLRREAPLVGALDGQLLHQPIGVGMGGATGAMTPSLSIQNYS